MTHEARILHVYPGRNRSDRLDVIFQIEKDGKPFEMDGYLWVKSQDRSEWVGSLLQAVQHTGERVRLRGEEKPYGWKITWAEKIETPVVRPFAVVR